MDREAFTAAASEICLALSNSQIDAFAAFEEQLYESNKVMNLTRVPREDCWRRHFIDSLLIHDLIPPGAQVLDIGTGPGFPAWPLACARPDLRITALDSNRKMLGYLMSNKLPNMACVLGRAEDFDAREQFDFVTGRALAPLSIQLELSAAFSRIGGLVVPLRTPADRSAAERFSARKLGLQLDRIEERKIPGADIVRLLPVFAKVKWTDRRYPRRWAEIKAQPLSAI